VQENSRNSRELAVCWEHAVPATRHNTAAENVVITIDLGGGYGKVPAG
jgi:hypothetical protein